MITYGIPSYNRVELKTVKTLLDYGVDKSSIIVSTQNKDNYEEYKKAWPGLNIIYREADCAGGNRNTLISEVGENLLLLDDDIKAFGEWDGRRFVTLEDVSGRFEKMFEAAKRNGAVLFGVSPSENAIVRNGRGKIDIDVLLQGTVIGVCEKIYFDERWKMVEDYEISLRAMTKHGHTIRFNDYVAKKPKNGTNKGGLHERYANGELPLWISKLEKTYSVFKANKGKTGGRIWRR